VELWALINHSSAVLFSLLLILLPLEVDGV